ncbi:MAG: hypothetical protein IID32_03005 [Planctomycetes bacterium]|nr:hypothetical protein [Planctomycetota bacterium]
MIMKKGRHLSKWFERPGARWILFSVILLAGVSLCEGEIRTDSRTPYVHVITLYDKDSERIDHKDRFEAKPYSATVTCGKCHDVEAIHTGWHFNAQNSNVAPGRRGEPWVWVDGETRTQLPLSYRDWPGTYRPSEVGLSQWEFARHFGRHLPGMMLSQPESESNSEDSNPGRWPITGGLEDDCLICHSGDPSYNAGEWAVQVEKENYQWASVAAAGLAVIKGDTRKLPDDFDPEFPELSGPDVQLPTTQYYASKFDANGRVFFDIVRVPRDERCYFCHTTHGVDLNLPPRHQEDLDIHTRAGMSCTDCHRHGLDHMVTRSYEGEETHNDNISAGTLTCRACHIGQEGTDDPFKFGGRLGAPIAKHEDFPAIHFEKMECTVCHSGRWAQMDTLAIQTSLAHGLGLSDEHRHRDDPPYLVEPVFLRQSNGKIGIHRALWPAFWAVWEDEKITPLPLEEVNATLSSLLKVPAEEKEDSPKGWKPITDEEIQKALKKIQSGLKEAQTAVYVNGGLAHKLVDGKISSFEHSSAKPYTWSLAHDVRGAGQSLGIRGCTDCHADDVPFFFGQVTVATPGAKVGAKRMHELQGDYGPEFKKTHLFFKIMIIGTMVLLLLHIGGDLMRQALNKRAK